MIAGLEAEYVSPHDIWLLQLIPGSSEDFIRVIGVLMGSNCTRENKDQGRSQSAGKSTKKSSKTNIERIACHPVDSPSEEARTAMYPWKRRGLQNHGHKCYRNATVQLLFCIQSFKDKYLKDPPSGENEFNLSMHRLAKGLFPGKKDNTTKCFWPRDFNKVLATAHPPFATPEQQDALECFLHIIRLTERNNEDRSRGTPQNPCDDVKIVLYEYIFEGPDEQETHNTRTEYVLPVPIPDEKQAQQIHYRKRKLKENNSRFSISKKKTVVDLKDCISFMMERQKIHGIDKLFKETCFLKFPTYVVVAVRKFILNEKGKVVKPDVRVSIPLELDLSEFSKSSTEAKHQKHQCRQEEQQQQQQQQQQPSRKELGKQEHLEPHSLQETQQMKNKEEVQDCDRSTNISEDRNDNRNHSINSNNTSPVTASIAGQNSPPNVKGTVMPDVERDSTAKTTPVPDRFADGREPAAADVPQQTSRIQEDVTSTSSIVDSDIAQPQQGRNYQLKAFVRHCGYFHTFGHYKCFVRIDQNTWLCCDDSSVTEKNKCPDLDDGYFYLYEACKNS